jgi:hypothetical protein
MIPDSLSLHMRFLASSTSECSSQVIDGCVTSAADLIALKWSRNPRCRLYFDRTKPLLHLPDGGQFVGKIGPVARETPVEFVRDCGQISAAINIDESLNTSTVFILPQDHAGRLCNEHNRTTLENSL